VPLLDLRASLLEAAGLQERLEEGRRIVERHPGADDRLLPVAGSVPDRRLILEPADIAVLEFELSGVASAGTTWMSFAYSPTGALNAYRVGDHLADGIIKSIDSTDVVIETDEGPLRLAVAATAR